MSETTAVSEDRSSAGVAASRYELLELIGKGSFGNVHRGYDTVANKEVAIKLIDLEDIEEDIGEIQREIAMLKQCHSPNITQYYGSAVVPGTSQLMIVMELMAASAADVVGEDTGGSPLPEPCIAYILREVLNALVYLHAEQRMHRDIKAANILLAADGAVKVSDFGVSAQLSGTVGFKRRTFVGSPLWMAPEVIEQSPDNIGFRKDGTGRPADGYDEAADIWALGITAIELATGEPPRVNVASFRLLFMIVRDEPPQLDGDFSTEFKDFVWQCLRKDPALRPSAMDLLAHPFVANAQQPPDLADRIAAFLQRRPQLLMEKQRGSFTGGYGTVGATLPRWDFAAAPPPGAPAAAANATGTVGYSNGGTVAARPVTAPPLADAFGTMRVAGGAAAAADFSGTMVRRHTDTDLRSPGAAAAGGAVAAAAPLDFGTVQVRPPTAAAAAEAAAAGQGAAVPPRPPPPSRLVIPNDPTVPDRPAAGAAYAAGPPSAAAGPAVSSRAQGDGGASKQLLQASLSSVAAGRGATPAVAAAAETAVAALGQLDAARPGAVRDALTEVLTQLSLDGSPSLAALKSSAHVLFGGGSDGGAGSADGAAAQGVPDLGPLGRFLLSRWRESVVRERVQQTQQWHAS